MSAELRDVIWQALHEAWADDEPLFEHADAVLALPEMQAIREWMTWAMGWLEYVDRNDEPEPPLPDSVVRWVQPE